MSEKIGVIGFGAWGAALSQHLASKDNDVTAWTRSKAAFDEFNKSKTHRSIAKAVSFSKQLRVVSDPKDLKDASLLLLATPARSLAEVCKLFIPESKKIVVSAIKGIEPGSLLTPLQFLSKAPGWSACSLAVLSGPSFASDVSHARPVSVVCASSEEAVAQKVAEIFSSPAFRVYTSDDTLGVELGGIVKNIVAIAAGVCDALGSGSSARAALITRGLAEMTRLAVALGAKQSTLAGLSGLGDLVMTASENQSRNRTVGLRLGAGESLKNIVETLGAEAEGVLSSSLIYNLAQKNNIELPITKAVVQLLKGEATAEQLANQLLTRPRKAES